MSNDAEQKGTDVPQHKRMAMGEKLDGTSLKGKGDSKPAKPQGGLAQAKKK
jgi:hypothetical protein